MSYWFTDPLIKGLIPLATASAVKGAASTFMVPRIFMGANALGEATGVLPGGADVIARVCARKRGFIVTDEIAVRFAPPYRCRLPEAGLCHRGLGQVPAGAADRDGEAVRRGYDEI